jgi:hypothetical protein
VVPVIELASPAPAGVEVGVAVGGVGVGDGCVAVGVGDRVVAVGLGDLVTVAVAAGCGESVGVGTELVAVAARVAVAWGVGDGNCTSLLFPHPTHAVAMNSSASFRNRALLLTDPIMRASS